MLLLPVLLTVAVIGLPALFGLSSPGLGVFVFALVTVLGVAGVPYMVMTIALVFWGRGRPAPDLRRAANLAPLILWMLVLLWWGSIILLNHGPEDPPLRVRKLLELFGWMSALVLGIGYLWVNLAHWLVRWITHRKVVQGAA